jgi:hypothetical protein
VYDLRAENKRLEEAICRLAEQDATLSLLCKRDGSCVVTVTMDGTLTDEEREAVRWAAETIPAMAHKAAAIAHCHAETLRKLDERLG